MTTVGPSHRRHRLWTEIIRHAVWLDARFNCGLRSLQAIDTEGGIETSYETLRPSMLNLGRVTACRLHRTSQPTARCSGSGATDQDGMALDEILQRRRRREGGRPFKTLAPRRAARPKRTVMPRGVARRYCRPSRIP